MSWFADLAGRAESLLNNLDEQTGAALRNQNAKKINKNPYSQYDMNWNQKSRHPLRNSKKIVTEVKSTFSPARQTSPTSFHSPIQKNVTERQGLRSKQHPANPKIPQFNLNSCPRTLVDDVPGDGEMMDTRRKRRHSAPLNLIHDESTLTAQSQNLIMENAVLKNDLNVMQGKVMQILRKLKKMDEGNDLDRSEDLTTKQQKLEDHEEQNQNLKVHNESLSSQLAQLNEKVQQMVNLEQKYQDEKLILFSENSSLKDTNHYLEDRIKDLTKNLEEAKSTQHKLETELRHANSLVSELKGEVEKSNEECLRLENDWEAYKHRVKSMLQAKDREIKSLQEGMNLTEDTKVIVEQLNTLKEERDELCEAITNVRNECDNMKKSCLLIENRHSAAERVVSVLRDALKEERSARNRAESQLFALSKELKNIQNDTGQTIASLRTALRDKEAELTHLLQTASSVKTADTSALNVADYDVTHNTIESEKIHYLTEALVQRQGRVDKLLAENNMLRIQMDKLESKYKKESLHRTSNNHSIVNVQTNDHRMKRVHPDSLIAVISNRMAGVIRRHPTLRILVIIYMICLHFWVLTVLLTSTPPENIPRKI